MGASGLCGTGTGRSAWCRPGSARSRCGADGERIRFTSAILPRWARRTRSLDAVLPILYLRGVSTGDFQEALGALLGRDAPNLSPSVIARLKGEWEADYARWQRRDLSARHDVYIWADGVYLQARMEPQAECMLVLIGTTPEGKKERLGFQVGVRESLNLIPIGADKCRAESVAFSSQALLHRHLPPVLPDRASRRDVPGREWCWQLATTIRREQQACAVSPMAHPPEGSR
jgi:Transposase, Mutator family